MSNFNRLTEAEEERLHLLGEELGETQRSIGKILRHGYESKNPFELDGLSNKENLEEELGHILNSICLLAYNNDISFPDLILSASKKSNKCFTYLHDPNNLSCNTDEYRAYVKTLFNI
jgi:NTP pyrophosphatase (non-canonical NTP hydrolase)